MPDAASDAGEMLLALVEALTQLQQTTGPWPAWVPDTAVTGAADAVRAQDSVAFASSAQRPVL
ncbi:hypothetical protein GY12_12990 [Micrococcus luteus]|nr:hypothetical protein GY12_12990 [Micrococcus luteus]